MLPLELAKDIGEVPHRSSIDHANPQLSDRSIARAIDPSGQVCSEGNDLSGVGQNLRCPRPDQASPAGSIEQRYPDAALEFGQPLRKRRCTNADIDSSFGPGGEVGDRHQVLELAYGNIGEGALHPRIIVQTFLTN